MILCQHNGHSHFEAWQAQIFTKKFKDKSTNFALGGVIYVYNQSMEHEQAISGFAVTGHFDCSSVPVMDSMLVPRWTSSCRFALQEDWTRIHL
jgi:hypothetical protein